MITDSILYYISHDRLSLASRAADFKVGTAQSSTTDYEHQPVMSGHRCCAAACDSRENTPVSQHGFAVHLHQFPSDDEVAAQWIRVLELQNMDAHMRSCFGSNGAAVPASDGSRFIP